MQQSPRRFKIQRHLLASVLVRFGRELLLIFVYFLSQVLSGPIQKAVAAFDQQLTRSAGRDNCRCRGENLVAIDMIGVLGAIHNVGDSMACQLLDCRT